MIAQQTQSHAGVSRAVASRALSSEKRPVSADELERVLEAAEQLGFRPNLLAQSLTTKTVNLVAVVVNHIHDLSDLDLFDLLLENEQVAGCVNSSTGVMQVEVDQEDLGENVLVAFTRDHASFTVDLANLGGATVCGTPIVDVPYDELTDVLDPALVDKLTAG